MRVAAALFFLGFIMNGNADHPERQEVAPLPGSGWRLVTDGVMGGVSTGRLTQQQRAGRDCLCLQGEVRTENNGGFIQMALDLDDRLTALASRHDGILLEVLGNGENYNLHLRTRDLWLPWQSYRAGFATTTTWQTVQLPFTAFRPYRTRQALHVDRLKRIGVVAIGRAFDADLCVAGLAFYRNPR